MPKILITGAHGQLGTELCHLLDEQGIEYVACGSKELDITNQAQVQEKFAELKPEVVFHCAAYTAVDKAEDEAKDLNWQVNEQGTKNIANAAQRAGATLIYISTDYVFDGTNEDEYQVDTPTNPKNEYGKAKLAGEEAVKSIMDKYYIIRTSWVFGEYGKNFVYTMLRLAKTHDHLTVVNDQTGRPTWTRTLAEFMEYAVQHQIPYGTYQLSNDGACTWYEFAKEILKDTDVKVSPVTSAEYPQKAYRPRHSVMSLEKVKKTGFKVPTWQEALGKFLQKIH
ncbi:dTDP-4-dehydrorhamnose reductase [Limosilactobacillus sp.]|jgi:dTDP-4-dehydrorhamnose reductase|uniref:dTDP-4-dehydrorhamnose reductase n=1 Tax=Limosilactobacillus sp. TaxID=2773925 RepID=UPI0025C6004F|nr:dTDP-4-dehydrorhamnose reductase [Limosilactobacillus sp.]MCI2031725.1 dTDP-4-dehydrorhamnose reductase [Limosilactobacillus sp.]